MIVRYARGDDTVWEDTVREGQWNRVLQEVHRLVRSDGVHAKE